jgi:hypothetical protein
MGEGATPPGSAASLRYALSPESARARGRTMALWTAGALAMPPILVIVLIAQMQLAPLRLVAPIAALLAILGAARGVAVYRATARRLRALEVTVGNDGIEVRTLRESLRIARADIARIVEVDGVLGGLRVELSDRDDLPPRIDLPRGGIGFADLRAALALFRPIERTPRRSKVARFALGATVVLAIFFMPFFVDDVVGRSRIAACAMILAIWVAMRAAIARA